MTEGLSAQKLQSIYTAIKESNIRPAQQFIDLYKLIIKKVKSKLDLEMGFFSKSDLFNMYIHHLFLKFGSKELTVAQLDELFSYIGRYKANPSFVSMHHFETVLTSLIGYFKDLKNTQHNVLVLKTALYFFSYLLKSKRRAAVSSFYISKTSKTFTVPGSNSAQMNVKMCYQEAGANESSILKISVKTQQFEVIIQEDRLVFKGKDADTANEISVEDFICELTHDEVYEIDIIQKDLSISIVVNGSKGLIAKYQQPLFKADVNKKDFVLFDNFNYEIIDLLVKIQENAVFHLRDDFYSETNLDGCFEFVDGRNTLNKTAILRDLQILYYFYSAVLDSSRSLIPKCKHTFFSLLIDLLPDFIGDDYLRTKQVINFIDYLIVCDEEKSMYNSYFKVGELSTINMVIESLGGLKLIANQAENARKINDYTYRIYTSILSRVYLFTLSQSDYHILSSEIEKAFKHLRQYDETVLLAITQNFITKIHFYSFYHQQHSEFIKTVLFAFDFDHLSTFFMFNLMRTMAKVNCEECATVIEEYILSMLSRDTGNVANQPSQNILEAVNFIFLNGLRNSRPLIVKLMQNFKHALSGDCVAWIVNKITEYNTATIKANLEAAEDKVKERGFSPDKDFNRLSLQTKQLDINPDEINKMFDFGGEKGTHKDAESRLKQDISNLINDIVQDMEMNKGIKSQRLFTKHELKETAHDQDEIAKPRNLKNLIVETELSDSEPEKEPIEDSPTKEVDPYMLYLLKGKNNEEDSKLVNVTLDVFTDHVEVIGVNLATDMLIVNYIENSDINNTVDYLMCLNKTGLQKPAEVEWSKLLFINYKLANERNFPEGYLYLINGLLESGNAHILLNAVFRSASVARIQSSDLMNAFIKDAISKYLQHVHCIFGARFSQTIILLFYLRLSEIVSDEFIGDLLTPKMISQVVRQFSKLDEDTFCDKDGSLLYFSLLYFVIRYTAKDPDNLQQLTTVIKHIIFKHDQKFIEKNWHIIMMVLQMVCQTAQAAQVYFDCFMSYCNSEKTANLLVSKYGLKPNMGKTLLILKAAFNSFNKSTFSTLAEIYEAQLRLLSKTASSSPLEKPANEAFLKAIEAANRSYNEFCEYEPYIDVS